MTAMVNTVMGGITPDDLGKTLMHEHVLFGFAGWYANDTVTPFKRDVCVKSAVGTLKKLKTYGLRTLVDATPNDCGRDPVLLKEISEKSEINIICSTGLYSDSLGGSAYYKFRSRTGGDVIAEISDLFTKELSEGIGNTGIRAGIIKVATGPDSITSYEEMVLKAAAQVQRETGVPITTHTDAGTMGPEQADLLISEGADPNRIVIGHIDGSSDINYHRLVLDRDVFIAFDRLGIENFPSDLSDTVRKACIIGLIGIGFTNKIMLSHDSVQCWLGRPFITADPTHVFENIIPAIKEAGVTDDQINRIMTANPRRLFSGA